MSTEYVIVASTTDNEEAAHALAAGAIEARLGACAQVLGPITVGGFGNCAGRRSA